METPQIVNNRRLQDKPRKEQANTRVMWRSLKGGTLSKRSQLQTATHCDSIQVPLLKWKNFQKDTVSWSSGVKDWCEGRRDRLHTKGHPEEAEGKSAGGESTPWADYAFAGLTFSRKCGVESGISPALLTSVKTISK